MKGSDFYGNFKHLIEGNTYQIILYGFIFWTIMFVTFFFEDTLETQTGLTLFAFFLALFSLQIPRPSMD